MPGMKNSSANDSYYYYQEAFTMEAIIQKRNKIRKTEIMPIRFCFLIYLCFLFHLV